MRLLLLALIVACGGPQVTGTVVDGGGEPLEGVHVTAVGTLCQTTSDAAGRFQLSCRAGTHQLAISRRGYVSEERTLDLAGAEDLGEVPLVRIPEGEGLFLLEGGHYTRMSPSHLERRHTGPPRRPTGRAWCFLEDPSPNPVDPGEVSIFAKGVPDWRLFRLDEEGCARRMSREGERWDVTWDERPHGSRRSVSSEQSVHVHELAPGRYAVVPWRSGSFREDRPASAEAGARRYQGHLLVVGAP